VAGPRIKEFATTDKRKEKKKRETSADDVGQKERWICLFRARCSAVPRKKEVTARARGDDSPAAGLMEEVRANEE